MHKFFCSYNNLTESYELSFSKNTLLTPRVNIQAENTLLKEIKDLIQELYNQTTDLKDKVDEGEMLNKIDEVELLLSNLYYSLFSSPLDLKSPSQATQTEKESFAKCYELASTLEKKINIPEYLRICTIIKNIFQSLLNSLTPEQNKEQTKTTN